MNKKFLKQSSTNFSIFEILDMKNYTIKNLSPSENPYDCVRLENLKPLLQKNSSILTSDFNSNVLSIKGGLLLGNLNLSGYTITKLIEPIEKFNLINVAYLKSKIKPIENKFKSFLKEINFFNEKFFPSNGNLFGVDNLNFISLLGSRMSNDLNMGDNSITHVLSKDDDVSSVANVSFFMGKLSFLKGRIEKLFVLFNESNKKLLMVDRGLHSREHKNDFLPLKGGNILSDLDMNNHSIHHTPSPQEEKDIMNLDFFVQNGVNLNNPSYDYSIDLNFHRITNIQQPKINQKNNLANVNFVNELKENFYLPYLGYFSEKNLSVNQKLGYVSWDLPLNLGGIKKQNLFYEQVFEIDPQNSERIILKKGCYYLIIKMILNESKTFTSSLNLKNNRILRKIAINNDFFISYSLPFSTLKNEDLYLYIDNDVQVNYFSWQIVRLS